MIQLTCANCRNQLEVDDAFAGSVCRCQHCGTIQTVPRKGQASGRPRNPGTGGSDQHHGDEPKALYQVKSRAGMSSHPSGLEELAEVVHSSGLGSGMLNRSSPNMSYVSERHKKKARQTMIIAIVGAVVLIGLGALITMLLMSGGSKSSEANNSGSTASGSTGISSPVFAGIALSGEKIMYVIDRGDATADYFSGIKGALIKSVKSLGPERRFAVLLWNNGADDSFPHTGTVYATSDEVGKLGNWLDNVSTGRATSVDSALNNALYQSPKEIILVTAKGDQLDDDFVAAVEKSRGSKAVTIHAISISTDSDALKKIAKSSGGKYLKMSAADLTAAGEN